MSTRSKFIIVVVVLLAVFIVAEYRMPRKFQWNPTFAHNDPQPFGCMVFDSVLAASMPKGYTVERRTLWQMEKDRTFTEPKAVMIITKESIDDQIPKVFSLVGQGNVMLVATTDLSLWCDTLGIDYNYYNSFDITDVAGQRPDKGQLCWTSDKQGVRSSSPARQWSIYKQLIERSLDIPDSVECEVLATFIDDSDTISVAASFTIGDGKLILVSAPLLLTNYMMVSGDGSTFIARLMGRISHLPVIRTQSYMSVTAQQEESPLYVLLKEPPLRWAVYLTILTLLLFCIFTARRRQRVIPIIRQQQNGNMEFVQLIGTLYWHQHDNAGLLAKKLAYTAEELRRQLHIDITATTHSIGVLADAPAAPATPAGSPAGDADAIRILSAHTGRDPEELRLLLRNINQAASGNYTVSDAELKTFIDELDSMIASI